MNVKVFIRPRAKEDIIEQATYIAREDMDAASRFLDAVEATLEALLENPLVGASRKFSASLLEGIRMWPVKGFTKHLIFYRPNTSGIDVIRIVYAARDLETLFQREP